MTEQILTQTMTKDEMAELIDKDLIFADGFDDAIIGVTYEDEAIVVYSIDAIVDILQTEHDMDLGEAVDYFEYNIIGAYVGNRTPLFISSITVKES